MEQTFARRHTLSLWISSFFAALSAFSSDKRLSMVIMEERRFSSSLSWLRSLLPGVQGVLEKQRNSNIRTHKGTNASVRNTSKSQVSLTRGKDLGVTVSSKTGLILPFLIVLSTASCCWCTWNKKGFFFHFKLCHEVIRIMNAILRFSPTRPCCLFVFSVLIWQKQLHLLLQILYHDVLLSCLFLRRLEEAFLLIKYLCKSLNLFGSISQLLL